jgi:hypothetical protein
VLAVDRRRGEMSEIELRELDARVHRVLYPGDDVSHILDFGPRLTYVGERVFRTSSRRWMRLPHYSTDIGAWEPVYALHPEWRWLQSEVTGDGYVAVVTRLQDHARADESQFFVDNSEYPTSGLDRLARGRARCVIAWAAGRGEG